MRSTASRAEAAPPSSLLALRSSANSPEKSGFGFARPGSLGPAGAVDPSHFSFCRRFMLTIFTMRATKALRIIALGYCCLALTGAEKPRFRAIGFFTRKEDQAHISFLNEAVRAQ